MTTNTNTNNPYSMQSFMNYDVEDSAVTSGSLHPNQQPLQHQITPHTQSMSPNISGNDLNVLSPNGSGTSYPINNSSQIISAPISQNSDINSPTQTSIDSTNNNSNMDDIVNRINQSFHPSSIIGKPLKQV
eukprot:329668_1